MAAPAQTRPHARESRMREGWMVSGLILFGFATTHLLNHAFGLFGIAAMDKARAVFLALWGGPIGTTTLFGAMALHLFLALRSIYYRRTLRMRRRDALQLVLGILIVPLLAGHVVDLRLGDALYGATPSYMRELILCWLDLPDGMLRALLLLVVWTHGCLGIHFWLSLKPWYRRYLPFFAALALLLPCFALIGFLEGLREIGRLAEQPGWVADTLAAAHQPQGAARQALHEISMTSRTTLGVVLLLVLAARHWRNRYERRFRSILVHYPGGRQVRAPIGNTVLDISRLYAIPHASVCGGRGRCSTCRVRIIHGHDFLPPPGAVEAALLKRVGAPADVRLACQLRPIDDVAVLPLLPAGVSAFDIVAPGEFLQGEEREICVLFADLRGFTRFAERKLPYDVVFFLNRYFDAMGGAIERAGGVVNQFTGDGVMALFGLEGGADLGCRQAFAAARGMIDALDELSIGLTAELVEPLRIGIGIHIGPTVVGRMGRGVAMYLTAVGDTVHVASRLQDLTKQYACQMVVSETVAARAGIDVSAFPRHEIAVRNRAEPIAIRTIADVQAMAVAR